MTPKDLTRDWPNDPDNDELAQLAERLDDAVPPLPADTMARVEQTLKDALDRRERRQRWLRVAFGWSIAAAILIAILGYALNRPSQNKPGPMVVKSQPPSGPVEDRVPIAVSAPAPEANADQPVVRLDDYRSLFAD